MGAGAPDEIGTESAQSTAHATAAAWGFFLPVGIDAMQGDNDFDGDVDADDIDNLADATSGSGMASSLSFEEPSPSSVFSGMDPLFDSNLDTEVTYSVSAPGIVASDSDYLVRVAIGTEYGDIDLDGDVDGDDWIAFQTAGSFGSAGGWTDGDFDGNGFVEGNDLIILQTNFGFASGSSIAVPEPVALSMVALALVLRLGGRHRSCS